MSPLEKALESATVEQIHKEAYSDVSVAKKESPDFYPYLFVEDCFNRNGLEVKDVVKKELGFQKMVAIRKCYLEIYEEFPIMAEEIFKEQMLKSKKTMDWTLIKTEKKVSLWEVFTPELTGFIVAIGFGKKKPQQEILNSFRTTPAGKKTAWKTAWTFAGEDRKGAEKFFDIQVKRDNYYF